LTRQKLTALPLTILIALLITACGAVATPTTAPLPAATTATGGAATIPATAARPGTAVATGGATRTTAATATRSASAAVGTPVAAPQPKLPVTVNDKNGKAVTITDLSRVIVLTGDVAETVWALGMGGSVIATDTSVTYPPEAQRAPKIGYMRTLAAEGILTQRPSLILGGESAGPPEALEQLRGAGVPVLIVATPNTLDAPTQKIRAIGAALGIPEVAEALASWTQAEIDAARALAAKAQTKPRVMFLNVRGNIVQQISGKGAPAQLLIEAAGGIDAGTAAGVVGYKSITPEALVAGQPEFYLLFNLGLESVGGVDGLLAIPGVDQTPAGQARRVLRYEDQYLLGLGPRTGQMLRELTLALHPELK